MTTPATDDVNDGAAGTGSDRGHDTAMATVGVRKTYGHRSSMLHAVDGVDIELRRGEILGLVGESGCGKSTLAKILTGSVPPTSGEVIGDGTVLPAQRGGDLRRRIQMVFQDPYSSLNPRMTVRQTLRELLKVHRIVPAREILAELSRLVHLVGLEDDALDAYPRQFSGGQRQRVAIARALAVRPDVLIADEPVSALDVSVQATILDLLQSLKKQLNLSVLLIAHNLAVVQHLTDRIAVMYLGRIVEVAPTAELFARPEHPYTRALIASAPRMQPVEMDRPPALEGEPPSPIALPTGCRFHPRCAFAQAECLTTDPALELLRGEHSAACLFAERLRPRDPNLKENE